MQKPRGWAEDLVQKPWVIWPALLISLAARDQDIQLQIPPEGLRLMTKLVGVVSVYINPLHIVSERFPMIVNIINGKTDTDGVM